MKRWIICVSLLIYFLLLYGCANKEEPAPTEKAHIFAESATDRNMEYDYEVNEIFLPDSLTEISGLAYAGEKIALWGYVYNKPDNSRIWNIYMVESGERSAEKFASIESVERIQNVDAHADGSVTLSYVENGTVNILNVAAGGDAYYSCVETEEIYSRDRNDPLRNHMEAVIFKIPDGYLLLNSDMKRVFKLNAECTQAESVFQFPDCKNEGRYFYTLQRNKNGTIIMTELNTHKNTQRMYKYSEDEEAFSEIIVFYNVLSVYPYTDRYVFVEDSDAIWKIDCETEEKRCLLNTENEQYTPCYFRAVSNELFLNGDSRKIFLWELREK